MGEQCQLTSFMSLLDRSSNDFSIGVVMIVAAVLLWIVVKVVSEIPMILYNLKLLWEFSFVRVPTLDIPLTAAEEEDNGISSEPSKSTALKDPKRDGFIQCYDPSTAQHLGQVVAMTEKDVNALCEKAKAAQEKWAQTTFAQRRLVLRTIQKYIVTHIDEICRVSTRDSGKPKLDALLGEVMTTCEKIRTINANGELWLKPSYRPTGPMMIHKTASVEYVPFGVLGIIAPWNYPFHNFLNHVISGLFSGNAIVSKVSEHTSWSAQYFGSIVSAALEIHGHDVNLVQTVTGFANAGQALVANPNVDKIIFTGSPGVGRHVMASAAKFVKPVILELGGKDPMVFCDDVKIKDIVPWAMRGCFQNCGQNCCGVERIFCYESMHDEFIDTISTKIKSLRQGIPLETCGGTGDVDCASMVMAGQIDIIQALVDDAVAKGATLHCGGKRNSSMLHGNFYEPTLLSGITGDMRISQEEVFGPVMSVTKVPNDSDDECIRLINNCSFGLGASVYCNDKARGLALARQIRSGMCNVNDFGVNYLIQSLPFGGVGESGFDRFAGPEGLRACCLERAVVVDRIPGVRTTIPSPIDYPIAKEQSLPFGSALLHLFYNESWWGKIKAIFGLIKHG